MTIRVMLHFYLRVILALVLLFIAGLLLIHAQPHDDHELRELLLPKGCPAPCFMGIRPGVTTIEEALRILRSSGWIMDIQIQPNTTWVIVRWNQKVPSWLLTGYMGNDLAIARSGLMVEEIHVPTALDLSQVELLMGHSQLHEVTLFRGMGEGQFMPILDYTTAYPNYSILATVSQPCDGKTRVTHTAPHVTIHYYPNMTKLNETLKQYHDSWPEVSRMKC